MTLLRRLLAQIPDDPRGLRNRVVLPVGFSGALRCSQLAALHFGQLERTDCGIWLTLPQTKGKQTEAATVPLPCGDTELLIRALKHLQHVSDLTDWPVSSVVDRCRDGRPPSNGDIRGVPVPPLSPPRIPQSGCATVRNCCLASGQRCDSQVWSG